MLSNAQQALSALIEPWGQDIWLIGYLQRTHQHTKADQEHSPYISVYSLWFHILDGGWETDWMSLCFHTVCISSYYHNNPDSRVDGKKHCICHTAAKRILGADGLSAWLPGTRNALFLRTKKKKEKEKRLQSSQECPILCFLSSFITPRSA